jgi:hypothetical protein
VKKLLVVLTIILLYSIVTLLIGRSNSDGHTRRGNPVVQAFPPHCFRTTSCYFDRRYRL